MPPKSSFIPVRPLTRSLSRASANRIKKSTKPVVKSSASRPNSTRRTSTVALVTDLKSRLHAASSPKYAEWLTRYLRDTPCRGLKTPEVQKVVNEWVGQHGLQSPHPRERNMLESIFESHWNEDKLAGTFYAHMLQKAGRLNRDHIPFIEQLFDKNLIQPWNNVDQFCSRVVADLVRAGELDAIVGWVEAENLWRARAGVVGLIPLLKDASIRQKAMEGCDTLIKREERFAKTAVGWVLREVHKHDEQAVIEFVKRNSQDMSLEATKNASKHMKQQLKTQLLDAVKSSC